MPNPLYAFVSQVGCKLRFSNPMIWKDIPQKRHSMQTSAYERRPDASQMQTTGRVAPTSHLSRESKKPAKMAGFFLYQLAARDWRLRSCGSRKRLRKRIEFGVTSTSSSSST